MPRHLQIVKTAAASPPEQPPPTGKHTDKYNYYVRTIHAANEAGGSNVLNAFYLLLDFEKAAICWRTSPQSKFSDVINEERFCSVIRFNNFKRAVAVFRKDQIKRLGLDAVCLIVRQPEKFRNRLLKKALEFRNKHQQEPTYQQLSRTIRTMVPRQAKPTYSQLRARVEQLEEYIREQGHTVPRATK
jgi:hypothetical protein